MRSSFLAWGCFILISVFSPTLVQAQQPKMPYRQAGLNDHDAAVHLLNRFTFGARPGDVQQVMKTGLDRWFEQQLSGRLPETDLESRLEPYPTLQKSDRELAQNYFTSLEKMAIDAGVVSKSQKDTPEGEKAFREAVKQWAKEKDYHVYAELRPDLMAEKLLRAVYAKNQTLEVVTDFWFNHFNISFGSDARTYMVSYEREAIRPRALGRFLPLLMATAKSPAMLAYLSNAHSVANSDQPTLVEFRSHKVNRRRRTSTAGLNENYGREVMELHTLGVDGGYTQTDVTQVARALTGWTIYPIGPQPNAEKVRQNLADGKYPGSIVQGDFLFRADEHDAGPKVILGHRFPAGGGLKEGEDVLKMLATNRSTARFICREIAVRFVADKPPEALVKRLADTFQRSGGDTRQILRTLVDSPEFWSVQSRGAKVKSPFELVASSMRALNAEVEPSPACFYWIDRMGQPLYAYSPPTGFPDRAATWVNSGTLTYRMNYSLNLASGRIRGVTVDLAPYESSGPQAAEQELQRVAKILLAGRDVKETIKDLQPLVGDPDFYRKVSEAARQKAGPKDDAPPLQPPHKKPPQLSQIVGILIGSPEFQKR